jgi:hypothetical protein
VRLPHRISIACLALAGLSLLLGASSALAASPPAVDSTEATNIEGISALLSGEINPNGAETHYRFQYVGQEAFSQGGFAGATSTPEATLASANVDRPVTASISGLTPDTTYHLRIVATNSGGTTPGAETTFATTHGFGFLESETGFRVSASRIDGSPDFQAGSHPYDLTTKIALNHAGQFAGQPGVVFPDGDLKDLHLELPSGLVGNPTVVAECTLAQFNTPRESPFEQSLSGESCPQASQVGVVGIHTSLGGGQTRYFGVFNLIPPPGFAVELGFAPFGSPVTFGAHVRNSNGDYGLTADIANFPQALSADSIEITLWGAPWVLSHNPERGNCLNETNPAEAWGKCSVGPPRSNHRQAFLTMPTSCAGPLAYRIEADSWQQPESVVSRTVRSHDEAGDPAGLEGCAKLSLETAAFGQPTTVRASSATGFEFNLEVAQEGLLEPEGLAGSQMREALVSLPEGMTINPSMGAGLGVCTPAQYQAETATSPPGAGCPNESKIGKFRVETPLVKEAVNGSLYLAKPFDNPFGSLIAVYLVAKASTNGILVKVPGELIPNQSSGRLTAHFENLPQLPYSHLRIFFREGQRAPITSPASCGTYPVRMELRPWLNPEDVIHRVSNFSITAGIGGGPCPSGTPPFTPGASDGSVNPNAGSYSPYYIHLTRKDTEQEITSYSAVLPPGLTGKLAGIPYCPDAAIAAAKAKTGTEELEHPSCPAASEVGHTTTGYGLGGVLTYAPGKLYLSGPYHGSPLSITAVDSALVGPFDLGVIIVRSALKINPITAQVTIDSAGSDPIPHIIDGIPLHLRDIRVYISKPNFTLNPTSCEPFQATSTLLGAGNRLSDPSDDVPASTTNLYQVTNCSSLKFKPKISIKLIGSTRRAGYPELRSVVRERPGDANIGQAVVALPHTEYLAQGHIREICTNRQFSAEACPPSSIYGRARAYSPLLSEPLEGPVYLRSSTTHPLPDMVVALRGAGGIAIDLVGRIDSTKAGGLRASFEVLPDAPASKFVLTLEGGKKGLLENSADICAATSYATGQFVGQDNTVEHIQSPMQANCPKKKGPKPGRRR